MSVRVGGCRVYGTYVEMLIEGVGSVGAGGICRGWKHRLEATNDDDIRCVTTAWCL